MLTAQRLDRRVRPQVRFLLESLESRLVFSAGVGGATAGAVVHHLVADHAHIHQQAHRGERPGHGAPATLPLNVSPALRSLYRDYEKSGGVSGLATNSSGGRPLSVSGTGVIVFIKAAFPPALRSYVPRLQARGLDLIRIVPAYGLAEGKLPIAALPAVSQLAAKVWPAPRSPMR